MAPTSTESAAATEAAATSAAPPALPPFACPSPAARRGAAVLREAAAEATATATATVAGNAERPRDDLAPSLPRATKRRRILGAVPSGRPPPPPPPPPPAAAPSRPSDHPDRPFGPDEDRSDLARAFRAPLFPKDASSALAVAYDRRDAAAEARKRARAEKKEALRELRELRRAFYAKKEELLAKNAALKARSREVGNWTARVFDLELREPNCAFNDRLARLRAYVAARGTIPERSKRNAGGGDGEEEERTLAAFVAQVRHKMKRERSAAMRHPHRIRALEDLGVRWERESDARFDVMFDRLLAYKREHGTIRIPSLDLCKASGDEDLVALHNWVFSQVGSYRYQLKAKPVEQVRRFLDAGFSFERWYATNGHVFERDTAPFDAVCRRYVENGGRMAEGDEEMLREAAERCPTRRNRPREAKNSKKTKGAGGLKASPEEEEGRAEAKGAAASADATKGNANDRVSEGEGAPSVKDEEGRCNDDRLAQVPPESVKPSAGSKEGGACETEEGGDGRDAQSNVGAEVSAGLGVEESAGTELKEVPAQEEAAEGPLKDPAASAAETPEAPLEAPGEYSADTSTKVEEEATGPIRMGAGDASRDAAMDGNDIV